MKQITIIIPKKGKILPKKGNLYNLGILDICMKPENKIYKTFFDLKESRLYYNQIKEYSKLSHSSLQNILKKLIEKKVISCEKTKSNKFYQILNRKLFSLKFSEIALQNYINLNTEVRIPLENFLKNLPNNIYSIILFGSASRKEENENSDIDLLVISNTKIDLSHNKNQAEISSNYPFNIFYCSIDDFIENKDHIIIQARKTGFPIYREQNFYEVILNEY